VIIWWKKILAGTGMELRFRLAKLDEHDRILAARYATRSNAETAAVERRHRRNVAQFSANAQKR
jgi:hypothetical protein